jgi:hypothetical protein
MINRKKVKMTFIKVIEPHKNLTPHLHAVIYVPNQHAEHFYNRFHRYVKSMGLKQCDIERLSSSRHSISYLLKYTTKSLDGSTFYHGWRIYAGINKIITYSSIGFNSHEIRTIVKSGLIPYDPKSNLTYYEQIESKVFLTRTFRNSQNFIFNKSIDDPAKYDTLPLLKTMEFKPANYEYIFNVNYLVNVKDFKTFEVELENPDSFQGFELVYSYSDDCIFDFDVFYEEPELLINLEYDYSYHTLRKKTISCFSTTILTLDKFIIKSSLDII